MTRKKRVVSINGSTPESDVLDDIDLEIISDLQAEEWRVSQKVQRAVAALEARILAGAKIVAKRFVWDSELRMVRSARPPVRNGRKPAQSERTEPTGKREAGGDL